jgi:hypothetical protein
MVRAETWQDKAAAGGIVGRVYLRSRQAKALCPVIWRPTMQVCISTVPS